MAAPGAWAAAADATRSIPDGTDVAAFDGSFNGDTTVLVVATVDQRPHIDLVELWEPDGRQVPVVDVEQAIRQACRRWRVLEIAADPFRWARSLQLLDGEGLPVLEYAAPGWPRNAATRHGGSTPRWPPSWPHDRAAALAGVTRDSIYI